MLNTTDLRQIAELIVKAEKKQHTIVTVVKDQCRACNESGPWQLAPQPGQPYPDDWANWQVEHAEKRGKDHYRYHQWSISRNPGRYVGRL